MKRRLKENVGEVGPESSVDAQILAFFTKADRMAIKDKKLRTPLTTSGVEETLRRKKMSHLFEAEGEEDEEEEEEESVFNVETFASEVARLLGNPIALLNFEQTVVKMAKNYVKNAYDEKSSLQLETIFEEEYDIGTGTKKDNNAGSNFAVGARTPIA
jgi:hypothetical protein